MSNRIEQAFADARKEGRAALIPYVTAGYPDLEALPGIVEGLASGGADLIEVGIPFSDPLADGPVLQKVAVEALARGAKVRDILSTVGSIARSTVPIVFLTYINPVFRFGLDAFAVACREAGVEGLIIPDLPWLEAGTMREAADRADIGLIPLVAPTSTKEHIQALKDARGFIYGVSVTGVTGVRSVLDAGLDALIDRVRREVTLPIAVGFGISTPEHARQVGQMADGVIVGSALMKEIMDDPNHAPAIARQFTRALRSAL